MKYTHVLVVSAALAAAGCGKNKGQESAGKTIEPSSAPASEAPAAAKGPQRQGGIVIQTMNAAGYTYVQLDGPKGKVWSAGPETAIAIGDKVEFNSGSAMTNFHSKSLDRSFEIIYFVPAFVVNGVKPSAPAPRPSAVAPTPTAVAPIASAPITFDGIEKPAGGKTVAEVFAEKASLGGKEVTLRGKVVKYNGGIMSRNWLHLQDGTGAAGSNDLTITTKSVAAVGDTVLVKGTISLDKDFGGGYKFGVIVEDATVTVE